MDSKVSKTVKTKYFADHALACHDNNWSVIKIPPGEKKADFRKWNVMDVDREKVSGWVKSTPFSNVGFRTGRTLVAIDVDTLAKGDDTVETQARALEFSEILQDELQKAFGKDILIRRNGTGDSRFLVPLRCADILKRSTVKFSRDDFPDEEHHIEVLGVTSQGKHNQFVSFGYRADDGGAYCWDNRSPANTRADELAECSHEQLIAVFSATKKRWAGITCESIITEAKKFKSSVTNEDDLVRSNDDDDVCTGSMVGVDRPYIECELMLQFVLQVLEYDSEPYDSAFLPVQMAWRDYCASKRIPSEEGLATFLKYVRFGRRNEAYVSRDWRYYIKPADVFETKGDKKVTFRTLIDICKKQHEARWLEFEATRMEQISTPRYENYLEQLRAIAEIELNSADPKEVLPVEKTLDALAKAIRDDERLIDTHRGMLKPSYKKEYSRVTGLALDAGQLRIRLHPKKKFETDKKIDPVTLLFNDVIKNANLFKNEKKVVFIDVEIDGERRSYSIHSQEFRDYLLGRGRELTGKLIESAKVDTVCLHLDAKGRSSKDIVEVAMRCGYSAKTSEQKAQLFYDLYNDKGQIIEIADGRWQVLSAKQKESIPVRFVRGQRGVEMPVPTPCSDDELEDRLDELWQHIHAPREWRNVVLAYLVDSLMPHTPHPLHDVLAEHRSGKTYGFARPIRELIDPQGAAMSGAPTTLHELKVSLAADYASFFDNASELTQAEQDALCVAVENGTLPTRELYTTQQLVELQAGGPVCTMTTEPGMYTRPDAQDRLLTTMIEKHSGQKKSAPELWEAFVEARPRLFGALLTLTARVFDLGNDLAADDSGHRNVSLNRVYAGVMHVQGKKGVLADLTTATREQRLVDSGNRYPMLLELQICVGMAQPDTRVAGTAKTTLDELIKRHYHRLHTHVDLKVWTIHAFAKQLAMPDLTQALGMQVKIVAKPGNKRAKQYEITKNERMPTEHELLQMTSMGHGFDDRKSARAVVDRSAEATQAESAAAAAEEQAYGNSLQSTDEKAWLEWASAQI